MIRNIYIASWVAIKSIDKQFAIKHGALFCIASNEEEARNRFDNEVHEMPGLDKAYQIMIGDPLQIGSDNPEGLRDL